MWHEVVLDDLSPGDLLKIVDTDGLRMRGTLQAIRWRGDSLASALLIVAMPLDEFEGDQIGASLEALVEIEIRDVRKMRRWRGSEKGRRP